MKIVLTGGGTAGHVTPHLAIIPKLLADGHDIYYIGTKDGIEHEIICALENVQYFSIHAGKLRRYHDWQNFTDVGRTLKGVYEAGRILRSVKPDVVFSKGGFVGLPVVAASALLGVPALVHESDLTSGLANKLCLPFAKVLMCTFQETAQAAGKKGVYVGAPIRPELLSGNRERGLKTFGFTGSKPVLLVMGGSLGAQAINMAVRGGLDELTHVFNVLHICGNGNIDFEYERRPGYVQTQYLTDEMADALACADLVVSRAGSNSICELLALRKPSLLIPYPTGASRGDQEVNAASFERSGFARVLEQKDLTSKTLLSKVIEVYRDRGELIEAMNREPVKNGNENIIKYIYQYAKKQK
ncbi:MAG: undecaprenyldiphospho-muramoylpentapeptide beta-N-acetylglucosaminyltransferase [Clostridia bacterium]|nr:undecaprenyldiphospho-muramoylpentapeptide beta-N-acetylglucosaminyltransferase [Clostridia bacterium]